MRLKHILSVLSILPFTLLSLKAEKPNIVLIFADDLGYGDLSSYGAEKLKTPFIDKLAAEGRLFTDAHSASAVCSPSRYGLMTGQYPYRKNFWGPVGGTGGIVIEDDQETISSLAKKAGYQTAFFGKWHLGFGKGNPDWNGELKPGPLEHGFDYFYGIPCANSVPPFVYVENYRVDGLTAEDPIGFGKDFKVHATSMEGKGAGKYGGGKVAHELYVDEEIGTNLTQRSISWLEKAEEETPFFLVLSTTNIHHPFTPAPQFSGTSQAGAYGDFVHELDWMTGEIMKALEKKGVAENTLLIFTSDNGGMLNQEGQRAVKKGHFINGDLLGSKFGAWEGGHRIPLIMRWPRKIPAGTTSEALISHVDFLATFSEIMDVPLENTEDSLNQLPSLTGTPETPVRTELMICPNSPFHLSIRKGDWVFIPRKGEGGFQDQKPGKHHLGDYGSILFMGKEHSDIVDGKLSKTLPKGQLYNLKEDLRQSVNLYDAHPEIVAELSALLEKERATIPKGKPLGWINIRLKE